MPPKTPGSADRVGNHRGQRHSHRSDNTAGRAVNALAAQNLELRRKEPQQMAAEHSTPSCAIAVRQYASADPTLTAPVVVSSDGPGHGKRHWPAVRTCRKLQSKRLPTTGYRRGAARMLPWFMPDFGIDDRRASDRGRAPSRYLAVWHRVGSNATGPARRGLPGVSHHRRLADLRRLHASPALMVRATMSGRALSYRPQ